MEIFFPLTRQCYFDVFWFEIQTQMLPRFLSFQTLEHPAHLLENVVFQINKILS